MKKENLFIILGKHGKIANSVKKLLILRNENVINMLGDIKKLDHPKTISRYF